MLMIIIISLSEAYSPTKVNYGIWGAVAGPVSDPAAQVRCADAAGDSPGSVQHHTPAV